MSVPNIEGLKRLLNILDESPGVIRREIGTGLYENALMMFAKSQGQVPVATGVLRGTGIVEPPSLTGRDEPEVLIGYGGPAAPYAKVQHENLTLNHNKGEKAKYLEDPVMDGIPGMKRDIERRLFGILDTIR